MAVIEAIATTYCEADVAYVDFTGIGSGYEHLQVRASGRAVQGTTANPWWGVRLQTGGSVWGTSSIYAYQMMYASGSTKAGSAVATHNDDHFQFNGSLGGAASQDTAACACIVVDISDYANTNKNTSVIALAGSGLPNSSTGLGLNGGVLDSTSAITGVRIAAYNGMTAGTTLRGSEFTLYGITG